MNSRLISACALAGIALTFFGAGTATADEDFTGSIGFLPDSASPGESVEIVGTCDDPDFTTAPVVSDVLDAPDLSGTDDGNGGYTLKSLATVKENAPSGPASVSFMCGTTKVAATFEVTPAAAAQPARIAVKSDGPIRPGSEVTVIGYCYDRYFVSSPVESEGVLTVPDLVREEGSEMPMYSRGTVDKDAAPGTYTVSFTCGTEYPTGQFTVVAAAPPTTPPVAAPPQVPVKPKGAADTGSLDPASEQGSGAGILALGGLALLAAGGGVGLAAYRRRHHA